jgi:hypothetical protein
MSAPAAAAAAGAAMPFVVSFHRDVSSKEPAAETAIASGRFELAVTDAVASVCAAHKVTLKDMHITYRLATRASEMACHLDGNGAAAAGVGPKVRSFYDMGTEPAPPREKTETELLEGKGASALAAAVRPKVRSFYDMGTEPAPPPREKTEAELLEDRDYAQLLRAQKVYIDDWERVTLGAGIVEGMFVIYGCLDRDPPDAAPQKARFLRHISPADLPAGVHTPRALPKTDSRRPTAFQFCIAFSSAPQKVPVVG